MREAALLDLGGGKARKHLGVVHHVRLAVVVLVHDDGLGHADLVGGEADGIVDGGERVDEVLRQVGVLGGGGLARSGEDGLVVDQFLDHGIPFKSCRCCTHIV